MPRRRRNVAQAQAVPRRGVEGVDSLGSVGARTRAATIGVGNVDATKIASLGVLVDSHAARAVKVVVNIGVAADLIERIGTHFVNDNGKVAMGSQSKIIGAHGKSWPVVHGCRTVVESNFNVDRKSTR